MLYGKWYGGPSYSPADESDVEEFRSLKQAKEVMQDRYDNIDGKTPAVSDDEMMLFSDKECDNLVYALWRGPRGAVRVDRQ